jgi:hypothetical protein
MTDTKEMPGNVNKDPDEWVTGDETMTGAQASYLKTLCEEAGEPFDPNLTKAEALCAPRSLKQNRRLDVQHLRQPPNDLEARVVHAFL